MYNKHTNLRGIYIWNRKWILHQTYLRNKRNHHKWVRPNETNKWNITNELHVDGRSSGYSKLILRIYQRASLHGDLISCTGAMYHEIRTPRVDQLFHSKPNRLPKRRNKSTRRGDAKKRNNLFLGITVCNCMR